MQNTDRRQRPLSFSEEVPLNRRVCYIHNDNTTLFSQVTEDIWNMFVLSAIYKADLAVKRGKSQFGPQSSNIWDIRWDNRTSCEIK